MSGMPRSNHAASSSITPAMAFEALGPTMSQFWDYIVEDQNNAVKEFDSFKMFKRMKKLLITLISITLCISCILSFSSCDSESTECTTAATEKQILTESYSNSIINSDPQGAQYIYFFVTVEELTYAMKKDPEKYNNAKVKLIGTIYIHDNEYSLVDYTMTTANAPGETFDVQDRYWFYRHLNDSKGKIEINITNDAQYAVAETGDFVKLYGTVRLTRNGIYLDSCEYELIASLDERVETVRP